jgi:cytochrome b
MYFVMNKKVCSALAHDLVQNMCWGIHASDQNRFCVCSKFINGMKRHCVMPYKNAVDDTMEREMA